MSDRRSYKFKNGKFTDLSLSELKDKLPRELKAPEVMELLVENLGDNAVQNSISFDEHGIWYLAEDHGWQLILGFERNDPHDLPTGQAYNYQFKAHPSSQANSGKPFVYISKLNTSQTDETETLEYIPPSLTLRHLLDVLVQRFGVDREDLLTALERIELGTFQIDLVKHDSKPGYWLKRLFQAQAMSFKEQRRIQCELDLEAREKEVKNLSQRIIDLERTIDELQARQSDLPRLQEVEGQYQELCKRLNLKPDSDLGFYGLASLRKQVGDHFKANLLPGFRAVLKDITIPVEDTGSTLEKLSEAFTGYLNSQEDSALLEPLKGVTLADLPKVCPALNDDLRHIIADAILYHFSATARRELHQIQGLGIKLREYGLDFFFYQPGDSVSASSCRYVSVRESEYPRGACVESVAAGIKRINSDSVIYKADVIIST